jgi:hypothetical protein
MMLEFVIVCSIVGIEGRVDHGIVELHIHSFGCSLAGGGKLVWLVG